MSREFVVFDAAGEEIDWYDPYESHDDGSLGIVLVDSGPYTHTVTIPKGGRYEIREMRETDD